MLVFKRPNVADDAFANINDKMGGYLGDLIDNGVWTGETGENLLLATRTPLWPINFLCADLVLKRVRHGGAEQRDLTNSGCP